MRVLIACEFSGIERDAFLKEGFDAWSCDLLPSESPGPHLQKDALSCLDMNWDLMIAHPPCTFLAVSGARWFNDKGRAGKAAEAVDFFLKLAQAPIKHIAIENPVGIMSRFFRKPDQTINPWQFGHGEVKKTCLWLKNLPKLQFTEVSQDREERVWKAPPSKDRWKERSRSFEGVAKAMAEQWGDFIKTQK